MCSILGIFDLAAGDDLAALRRRALALSRASAIAGRTGAGCMPMTGRFWSTNGWPSSIRPVARSRCVRPMASWCWRSTARSTTIVNSREGLSFDFTSGSDCEVINALYRERGQ